MALAASDIEKLIRAGIPGAEVTVSDLRGDGNHYAVHVVSEAFRGRGRIEQHRMIHSVLEGRIGENIQALALQTTVPG